MYNSIQDFEGLYKLLKISKIIWLDPNNVDKLLQNFQYQFGKSAFIHVKSIQQISQIAQESLTDNFLFMTSSKMILQFESRLLSSFKSHVNIYKKILVFCGSQASVQKVKQQAGNVIVGATFDEFQVVDMIKKLDEKLKQAKTFEKNIYFVCKNSPTQYVLDTLSIFIKLSWQQIKFHKISEDQVLQIQEQLDYKNQSAAFFSVAEQYTPSQIQQNFLDSQSVGFWYIITKQNPQEYKSQFTIAYVVKQQLQKAILNAAQGRFGQF